MRWSRQRMVLVLLLFRWLMLQIAFVEPLLKVFSGNSTKENLICFGENSKVFQQTGGFLASQFEFTRKPNGEVVGVHKQTPPMNEREKAVWEAGKSELMANVQKGIEWARSLSTYSKATGN